MHFKKFVFSAPFLKFSAPLLKLLQPIDTSSSDRLKKCDLIRSHANFGIYRLKGHQDLPAYQVYGDHKAIEAKKERTGYLVLKDHLVYLEVNFAVTT